MAALATSGRAQSTTSTVRPEFRVELTTGDVRSALLGAGLHVRSGTYFRAALLAGFGSSWKNGERGSAARIEFQGRFHLDPLREALFGLYGIGGAAATLDAFDDWQARLVVGAGVELPAHGRGTLAIEAALAGGFRLSMVARRLQLGRR